MITFIYKCLTGTYYQTWNFCYIQIAQTPVICNEIDHFLSFFSQAHFQIGVQKFLFMNRTSHQKLIWYVWSSSPSLLFFVFLVCSSGGITKKPTGDKNKPVFNYFFVVKSPRKPPVRVAEFTCSIYCTSLGSTHQTQFVWNANVTCYWCWWWPVFLIAKECVRLVFQTHFCK